MKTAILKSLVFFTVAMTALSACAAKQRYVYPANPANPYKTVAVLPVYNATADVGGPKLIREKAALKLAEARYNVLPLKETDRILADRAGITLGTQAELADIRYLGKELGVDALLYGYLLDFDSVTLGVYNVKKVRAAFKLVDARNGSVIWSGAKGVKIYTGPLSGDFPSGNEDELTRLERDIPGVTGIEGLLSWKVTRLLTEGRMEDLAAGAAISLFQMAGSKVLGKHLSGETNDAVELIFYGLPAGPGE